MVHTMAEKTASTSPFTDLWTVEFRDKNFFLMPLYFLIHYRVECLAKIREIK